MPSATANATIGAGATAYPVINAAGAACYRLEIQSGASLELSGTNGIDIHERFENEGSFEPGNGRVSFVGNCGTSVISSTSTLQFYDLTINNANGAQLTGGPYELINELELTNGDFATNNSLTLLSDINGTARVAEITGGSISGNVVVQRYIPSGPTNWRLLTSPVGGQVLDNWEDNFITSGYPGSHYPTFPFVSVYTYDESISGTDLNNGYVAATSSNQSIGTAQGFWVWCGDNSGGTAPFTIDVNGAIHSGVISPSLSFTSSGAPDQDGWNLIGNPYPSPIDFSLLTTTGALETKYWIYDPQSGNTECWDEALGINVLGLADGNLGSSQAFWVHATGSASITFNEADKTDAAAGIFKAVGTNDYFALRLDDLSNNTYYDRTVIRVDDNADVNLDASDTHKLYSGHVDAPRITSLSDDGFDLAIQSTPIQGINRSIPIKTESSLTGQFSITVQDLDQFSGSCLLLEDLQNGAITDLMSDSVYTFYQFGNSALPRFLLHVGGSLETAVQDVTCHGDADGAVVASGAGDGPWDYVWTDAQGSIVRQSNNVMGPDTLTASPAATYQVTATPYSGMCPATVATVTINEPQPVTAGIQQSADTVDITNPTVAFNYSGSGADDWFWDFGDGNALAGTNAMHTYASAGTYTVTQTVSFAGQCPAIATSEVVVVTSDPVGISDQAGNAQVLLQREGREVFLQFDLDQITNAETLLFDLRGQLVKSHGTQGVYKDRILLDTRGLAQGNYIVTVTMNGTVQRWQFSR